MRCPSGALHFERKDGGAAEPIPVQNIIIPTVNGPLYVRGNIRITTNVTNGVELQDTRLALCRCGASGNKPFCDNSHLQVEFQDMGQVTDNQVKVEAEHRPLTIIPKPNGPLRLIGDFEIRSASGQTIFRGTGMTLCRCGGSSNKPFCDNTHKRIGFTDAA
jgi:CDGSH-type Zn-finger protein